MDECLLKRVEMHLLVKKRLVCGGGREKIVENKKGGGIPRPFCPKSYHELNSTYAMVLLI